MPQTEQLDGSKLAKVLLSLLVLACGGCQSCRLAHPTLPAPEEFEKSPLVKSKEIEINFYLDTTESMRGYLKQPDGKKNYFAEILDKSTGILGEGWDTVRLQFWGFGERQKDPSRIDIRTFKNEKAYTGTNTYIDRAVKAEAPQKDPAHVLPRLKIILTDLYQEGNDLDTLGVYLGETLRDSSRAVGILGLRNPFGGPIDDLPNNQKLRDGAADSLPFYLLISGPIADVKLAIDEIIRRLDLKDLPADQKVTMIFSQRQVNELVKGLNLEPADKSGARYELEDNRIDGAAERFPYLARVKDNLQLVGHTVRVRSGIEAFPDSALNTIGPQVLINKEPRKKAFTWTEDKHWTEFPQAAAALQVNAPKINLDHSRLTSNTIYLFEIDFMAQQPEFNDLSAWNIELADVPRIMEHQAFDLSNSGGRPGKTPNLRHFLRTLASKMYLSDIPLARYYFYLQTN